ncbi:MAG: pilus assembly protein PilP [Vicinamibacterales bacterium]
MTRHHPFIVAALVVTAGASQPLAQAPTAQPAPAAAKAPPSNAPAPPANYAYTVDGRRDPFVSLITPSGVQQGKAATETRVEGVAGLTAEEIVVRGIIDNRGSLAAMVSGAAGKVYTVRPGDRLADGTIRTITPQMVIILQQVNDPLSLEKQREVRKFLRGGENK